MNRRQTSTDPTGLRAASARSDRPGLVQAGARPHRPGRAGPTPRGERTSTRAARSAPLTLAAASGMLLAGLHALGGGVLGAPPLLAPDELSAWAVQRDPVTIGMVVVRLIGLAVGYHLLATSLLAVVARVLGCVPLARLACNATLPPLRGAVQRLVGLSLSAAAVAATAPGGGDVAVDAASPTMIVALPPMAAGGASPDGATLVERLPDGSPPGRATMRFASPRSSGEPTEARMRLVRSGSTTPTTGGRATLRYLGAVPATPGTPDPAGTGRGDVIADLEAVPAPADGDEPGDEPDARAEGPGTARAARGGTIHVVRPGDHLWFLATSALTERAGGARPDQPTVAAYWLRVLRANPQLVDPDLLLPGDHITLPPLPA